MEEYKQLIVMNVSAEHAHKSEIHKKVKECEKDRAIGMYGEEKMHANESSRFLLSFQILLEDKKFPLDNLICEHKNNNSRRNKSTSCDIKFCFFLGSASDINSYIVR